MRTRFIGIEHPVAITLRGTHIYIFGRDVAGWKLLHRHADHLTAFQPSASLIER